MEYIVKRLMETHNVNESVSERKPLSKLSEEEISNLPEQFLCVTRMPGASSYVPVFNIVHKKDIISNPDKCFIVDSYWGYAYSYDIYIATREDLEDYRNEEISKIESTYNKYRQYLLR